MARKRGLPPGARRTSSGRITITIPPLRIAHSKVKPDEPKTYANETEAWEGYARVIAYRDSKATQGDTLDEFWAKWTNPEHHWNVRRGEPTVIAYASRTRGFVNFTHGGHRYGDLPLTAFTVDHLDAYMEEGGGLLSHVGAISRIFHDAIKRKRLNALNPFADAAAEASQAIKDRTKENRDENPPPTRAQVEQMLTRLKGPAFPRSLYGWFLTGCETGMRGGEIDGMEWSQLEGDVYWIKRQWNAKLNKQTKCKHGSERKIRLNARIMAEINAIPPAMRGKYIWTDTNREHWTHNTRAYWWTWGNDGNPSPRQIVGGATMYNTTRHHWATRAVNEMGLTPYEASLLFGHSDGGKLITDVYANPDHKRAMDRAVENALEPPVDLDERRQRREGGS